jgi:hypothetical protein
METKFRPIPITILDFFAILLPGFVWFLLIETSLELALNRRPIRSPLDAWQILAASLEQHNSWLGTVSVIIVSALIGYVLKPKAMTVTEALTISLFRLSAKTKKVPRKHLKFPYDGVFADTEYYKKVNEFVEALIRCPTAELPGSRCFGAAKRYLRLVAPSLWEESERMEAEVRMTGTLFLACLYSVVLSAITLILSYVRAINADGRIETLCWLLLSLITTLILGFSFNRLRLREVGYTYLNTLIASGSPTLLQHKAGKEDEE